MQLSCYWIVFDSLMETDLPPELIVTCPYCNEENELEPEELDSVDSVFCGECGLSIPVTPMDLQSRCPECDAPRKRKRGKSEYTKFCFKCRFSFEDWKPRKFFND